jgi:RNA polymerase sigma-70 factor (ECF subfamily)
MKSFHQQSYATEIRAGNRLAFSDYFRKNHDRYVRFAIRFVGNKSDALDIVQEVFIKLWENRAAINPDKSLSAFVFTSIRNKSLNFIRDHQAKFEETELDELPAASAPDLDDEHSETEQIKQWIEALPERQREAFLLSRFEGLQHDEIAEIMNVSPRTVNNHIVAALKSIRDRMIGTYSKWATS